MSVTMRKDDFLSNPKNKQRFLVILSEALQNVGCVTHHANGDADLLIVKTAVASARTNNTVLVGDDTDLLVLLCYHASKDGFDLYFRPEPKANVRGTCVWHMKRAKDQLGREVCTNLLFLHAITGCDTTSRLYGVGKATALKKFENVPYFREQARSLAVIWLFLTFSLQVKRHLSHFSVVSQELVLTLSGSVVLWKTCHEDISHRATESSPNCSSGPISQPARYLQVKQWQGEGTEMSMEDWGWKFTDNQVFPVATDLPPAPDSLLQLIQL